MKLDEDQENVCGRLYKRYKRADPPVSKLGKTWYVQSNGKLVKYTAKPHIKGCGNVSEGKKTGMPEENNFTFVTVLLAVWEPFDSQCGKLLASFGLMRVSVTEFIAYRVWKLLYNSTVRHIKNK